MLKLIQKIKLHTEAGSILEHMELFEDLENYISTFKTQTKQDIFFNSKKNIEAMIKNQEMLVEAEIRMRVKKELTNANSN